MRRQISNLMKHYISYYIRYMLKKKVDVLDTSTFLFIYLYTFFRNSFGNLRLSLLPPMLGFPNTIE